MIKMFFLNWALRKSEAEIKSFLSIFITLSASEVGKIIGMAALMHYQYSQKDPEFEVQLNSIKGENRGPISTRILELSRLVYEMNRGGRLEDAASMNLWRFTFRCMMDDTLHHHGIALWKTAEKSFPEARLWLAARLEIAHELELQPDTTNLRYAITLYNYIPPQFRDS
ncbi:MAG: hypothetical protein PSV24_11620 [Rhodoferax sp.]|nr:hypothetical protein [Rhodoferax sp.]